MSSFEDKIKEAKENTKEMASKINYSMMKYLWLANPLSSARKNSIPRFLRQIELLKNFSDNELRILAQYMHNRSFEANEVIFREDEIGIGFYFIFRGEVELQSANQVFHTLEEQSYFGELALLQESNRRSATAVAKTKTELIGIFKPDLDHLIATKPTLAAKLLQSLSLAIADRLYVLTQEASRLANKVKDLEEKHVS